MLLDYHLHTGYCHHAVGPIDDYLRRAEELGMEEVCFTEHISRQWLPEDFKRQLPYTWMLEEELDVYLQKVEAAAAVTPLTVRRAWKQIISLAMSRSCRSSWHPCPWTSCWVVSPAAHVWVRVCHEHRG